MVTGGIKRRAALKRQAVAAEAAKGHVRAKSLELERSAQNLTEREEARERGRLLLHRLGTVIGIRHRAVRDILYPRSGPDSAAVLRLRALMLGWRFRAALRRGEEGLVGPLVRDLEAGRLVGHALREEGCGGEDECVWARRAGAERGTPSASAGWRWSAGGRSGTRCGARW